MTATHVTTEELSDADRDLLRKSVREMLVRDWPADRAVELSGKADAVLTAWRNLAGQGLAALGADNGTGGLREIALVFEELGRAACPAPLLGAVALNLVLAGQRSNAPQALLGDLHLGQAVVALALGAFDGDRAAGTAEWHGGGLTGKTAFIEGVSLATHILVFTGSTGSAAVVTRDAPGLQVRETPGLAVPPFSEIVFDGTPAMRADVPAALLEDIALVARLACLARGLGAAQRAFDLAVEHAKVRKQFGQFIGQFQAVQHKLANSLITLDGARLTLESAAAARDAGDPAWRAFAWSALAFAGPALREVSIQTHRALGAIGYAEEHEAPRHFRRVHADLARFGGAPHARAALAELLLGRAQ
jgi:alkylation response protein AidB-like acyl-CoA dehydrogenase